MHAPTSQSALDSRQERYETLFAGEFPLDGPIDIGDASVAGLCRATLRGRKRSPELRAHIEQVPFIINSVLSDHDRAARTSDEALFAFRDRESQDIITDIVASVFVQWEVTRYIHELPPLLSADDNENQWLVAEAAAAVATASSADGFNTLANKNDRTLLTKVIASRGPRFAHQWLNGNIMSQWMDEQEMPPEEQVEMLNVFSTGVRKCFAGGNIGDPLNALARSKHNLDEVLTDENIAEHLGWSVDRVSEVFTPGIRKTFAVRNMRDPLAATERVKDNLENILTDENIAQELGWSTQKVQEVFSPSVRVYCGVHNIKNPLLAVKKIGYSLEVILADENIAAHLGWTVDKVREIFTPGLLKDIATHSYKNPLHTVQKIQRNIESVLTDENVAKQLGWEVDETQALIGDGTRYRLATQYADNPLRALERIRHNLENILTDEQIAATLGWSISDTQNMFTPSVRKYFAMSYIRDPLDGCKQWIHGEISVAPRWTQTRDKKLAQIAKRQSGAPEVQAA